MKKGFFKDIIGYGDIKKSLERVIDVLNNKDKYEKLGSVIPYGLFIYGKPGLGKSTLAMNMIDEFQKDAVTC